MLKNGERYIGLTTTARPTRWVPYGPKLGGLDRRLEMLEASWMVNVATVYTALSLFIWFGLLWRASLSMPHALFDYCRATKVHGQRKRGLDAVGMARDPLATRLSALPGG